WDDIVFLLRDGLRRGRIVTTRPADRPGGAIRPEDAHYVYKRTGQPCRVCGTPVAQREVATRQLYWCPTCQSP
ncbi:MAG TPA: zinc finger domain-containing protein, partial [Actinomycetales bacterium]|nr:zinc finger domain-containing protein [Actinomycetales bacterium]